MTDHKKLIEEARGEVCRKRYTAKEAKALALELADALESATTEPVWEYGTGHTADPGVGAPEPSKRAAEIRTAAWNTSTRTNTGIVVRRRKAGPWLPV